MKNNSIIKIIKKEKLQTLIEMRNRVKANSAHIYKMFNTYDCPIEYTYHPNNFSILLWSAKELENHINDLDKIITIKKNKKIKNNKSESIKHYNATLYLIIISLMIIFFF